MFAVDPATFFGDYGKMNYYSISNSSVPFKLTNSGTVISNNVSISNNENIYLRWYNNINYKNN